MTSDELADHIIKRAEGRQRFIVAVAGPPGAGKSTLAEQLLGSLQKNSIQARIIPIPEIIDRHVPNLSYRLM